MPGINGILTINGNDYNILHFEYAVTQPMGSNYQPDAKPKGGMLIVDIESTKDTSFFSFARSNGTLFNGAVKVYREGVLTDLVRTLQFDETHCAGYKEILNGSTAGQEPMYIRLMLAAGKITINGCTLDYHHGQDVYINHPVDGTISRLQRRGEAIHEQHQVADAQQAENDRKAQQAETATRRRQGLLLNIIYQQALAKGPTIEGAHDVAGYETAGYLQENPLKAVPTRTDNVYATPSGYEKWVDQQHALHPATAPVAADPFVQNAALTLLGTGLIARFAPGLTAALTPTSKITGVSFLQKAVINAGGQFTANTILTGDPVSAFDRINWISPVISGINLPLHANSLISGGVKLTVDKGFQHAFGGGIATFDLARDAIFNYGFGKATEKLTRFYKTLPGRNFSLGAGMQLSSHLNAPQYTSYTVGFVFYGLQYGSSGINTAVKTIIKDKAIKKINIDK